MLLSIEELNEVNVSFLSPSKTTEEVYNKLDPVSNILAVITTLFPAAVKILPVLDWI